MSNSSSCWIIISDDARRNGLDKLPPPPVALQRIHQIPVKDLGHQNLPNKLNPESNLSPLALSHPQVAKGLLSLKRRRRDVEITISALTAVAKATMQAI